MMPTFCIVSDGWFQTSLPWFPIERVSRPGAADETVKVPVSPTSVRPEPVICPPVHEDTPSRTKMPRPSSVPPVIVRPPKKLALLETVSAPPAICTCAVEKMEVSDTVAELIDTVKSPLMMTSSPGCGTRPPLHFVGSSQLPPSVLIQVRVTCSGSTHAENSDVLLVLLVAVAVMDRPLPVAKNGSVALPFASVFTVAVPRTI